MSKKLLFSVFLLTATNAHASGPAPKMLTEPRPEGSPSLFDQFARNRVRKGKARVSHFLKRCSPSNPVEFPLSSGGGKGNVIVIDNDADVLTGITVDGGDASLSFESAQRNAFGAITDNAEDGTTGVPFEYSGVGSDGGTAAVFCSDNVLCYIQAKDEFDNDSVSYEIDTEEGVGGGATSRVEVPNARSGTRLAAEAIQRGGGTDANGRRHLKPSDQVAIGEATDNRISFDSDGRMNDAVLVQIETKTSDDRTIRRTVVTPTFAATQAVQDIELESSQINNDGDLELQFNSILPEDSFVLLQTVLQLVCGGATSPEVSLKAMTKDYKLVLNEGWILTAKEDLGAEDCEVIKIKEGIALDPEDGYVVVGHLDDSIDVALDTSTRRHLRAKKPSEEQLNISVEMKEGRSPRVLDFDSSDTDGIFEEHADGSHRNLQQNPNQPLNFAGYKGARILTHGYCAGGTQPFPEDKFLFNLSFDNLENNWSNIFFAELLFNFSEVNDLQGCSMVAHSQGGLAALTMKTFFHSCLDSPRLARKAVGLENARSIQTVGSPYRGTALQNSLTVIGDLIGIGCGFQEDLSEDGADKWLSTIPLEVRSNIYYYLTADRDVCEFFLDPRCLQFCQAGTALLLTEPEDGVVEAIRSQLEGGNDQGVAFEQCHTGDMNFPDQTKDETRNTEMDFFAPV